MKFHSEPTLNRSTKLSNPLDSPKPGTFLFRETAFKNEKFEIPIFGTCIIHYSNKYILLVPKLYRKFIFPGLKAGAIQIKSLRGFLNAVALPSC
ncbi:MAG: hypothetical protein A2W97_09285 [Bacteroidetes bacterium GWE2_40_63]|nr:MAG: hypothetical protein A2W84_06755 [Bacteroidetes bacterium GWC2_40_13]OFX70959.1 MAG: hypothetical protein A2W96_07555 [Bacteroidetes bacterium GWD2_40_43]OFX88409.1 MAG: hypothetical protein A2W97_09285 [Bacteroidetes bacterium GWE2_40_63]OFY23370.1 MAG: hypothetical protein A2W88_10765 [Bacteroidetes bacterium GWF2_40_13]HBX86798.1 hypothetical protein [Marinilabiliales bacterium]